jgi:hypothetical protein
VISLLAASVLAIALAPLLMPAAYSVVEHSVSESAAQGLDGAWLARLGFVLFGFAVLLIVGYPAVGWGRWARLAHGGFAVSMIAAATFSHMPWDDRSYDRFEDLLHSIASLGVGLFFTAGVLLVTIDKRLRPGLHRVLDLVALAAAAVIPMLTAQSSIGGVLQRLMFLLAYLWYAVETIRPRVRSESRPVTLSTDTMQIGGDT